MMSITRLALLVCMLLPGCAKHTETKTPIAAPARSPYSATLLTDSYNDGESNEFRLRLDAAPKGDDGWFFIEELKTDLATMPNPEVMWTSPNDLSVTVHTAKIDGQTRRRFGGHGRPDGSLIIKYVGDQPEQ